MNWTKRIEIIKSIAHALCYLHHDCNRPIVHRDISSNIVLLNSSLQAVVTDFGTARMLDLDSSNQTILVGTRGYIAPGNINGKTSGRSVVMVVVSIFFSKYETDRCVRQSSTISNKPTGCIKFCSRRYIDLRLLKSATEITTNDERSVQRIPFSPSILEDSPSNDFFVSTCET
ncbi:hypothetical protein V6N11_084397 [Hibiscus sabdariffa]|uniref:non-specific serine/threonine protein kinase n=2 Tax=Hibiscus sabdariffa TaxID=183260 RepID=A0ABR2NC06_9ROSI